MAGACGRRQQSTRYKVQMSTQQEFLCSAMSELGMSRDAFCARLGCAGRTLDKWLLPNDSKDHRDMDGAVWTLVREMVAHEKSNQLKTSARKLP